MKFRISFLFLSSLLLFSCGREDIVPSASEPKEDEPGLAFFSRFWITGGMNKGVDDDFACQIDDQVLEINTICPDLEDLSAVVVSFDGYFTSVTVNGEPQFSAFSVQDFTSPVRYDLLDELGHTTSYTVRLKASNGIPRIYINTRDNRRIESKTEYVPADFRIDNDPDNGVLTSSGQIRGRGNATWSYPKKPYKIEFTEKQSPFGFPANKDWVLLAEYCDKSLMRTAYMCALSGRIGLPYTINYRHVDLYFNGNYVGVYVLTDQVEKAKHRVNIADDGFLIENDNYWYQEPYNFETGRGWHFSFKYPKAPSAEEMSFIKKRMNDFESVLYGQDFNDPVTGYRSVIDERSFAKWYLLNEITGNLEPNIFYVLHDRGAKLEMYPDWDAEWSLGLAARGNDWAGWAMPPTVPRHDIEIWSKDRYFPRLLEDPYFVDVVKEEWSFLKPQLAGFVADMEYVASSLEYAQAANFERWKILDQYLAAGLIALGSWEKEVEYVRDFFSKRTQWFDSFYN